MSVSKVIYNGETLIDLTSDTVAADKMIAGTTAHDKAGNPVTGTFSIDSELETQDDLISRISAALEGKAGGSTVSLQSKTVSPSLSKQTITPDSGYGGLSNVVVNAMPTATQATPSITVYSNGLINAVATQSAGYVNAGTKNATKQLTVQASKTITPTKSSQTAVASGVYTTGAITVGAIPSNYIVPSGTLNVTANGTHNVANYASVSVSVAGGSSGGLDESYCLSSYNGSNLVRQIYCPDGNASGAMRDNRDKKFTNIEIGNNITSIAYAYYNCTNFTGNPVCGNNVTNMCLAYTLCNNITGSPVCGNNVTNMSYAYNSCTNLTGSPVCGDNVTNMSSTYSGCYNLTGSPICGDKVTNMSSTYFACRNLTGSPVCGNKVTDMNSAYSGCNNITGSPVCGNNVIYMNSAYKICYNLTGSPVCGDKVEDMSFTYYTCNNITGSPVCGNNVTNMSYAYYNCRNLTGNPVCGNNVTNMSYAYNSCTNLTGSPVCGPNVTDMGCAYFNCSNLTGNFICGNNVKNVAQCFNGSTNVRGNHYFNNCKVITNARHIYYNRNTSARLNVYVNSNCFNRFNITNSYSIVGKNITWSNTNTTCYYNTVYNIYLYKV